MIKLAAYGALAMAGCLLSLQVVAALEYTQGGTLYTQASMIAAMVTVAALPVFIEAARHTRAYGLMLALGVALVAMLAYSIPAQVGRAGEVKETKATGSVLAAATMQDLTETRQRLKWATDDWQQECASGAGKQCRSKGQTVEALRARADTLSGKVATAPVGDVASDLLSWATVGLLSAEAIRRGSVLAFVIGLDVAIWSLIWLATTILAKPAATVSRRDTVSGTVSASDLTGTYTDAELDDLRKLLLTAGRANNNELAHMAGVTKGEMSKRVSYAVARGVVSRRRVGREVAISLH